MLALDADIHVQGPKGKRQVKASQFFKDLLTVDLAADEMIVAVSFAPVRAAAYAKLHQRASHYAIVGVAAALDVRGGTIRVGSCRPHRGRAARRAADRRGEGARGAAGLSRNRGRRGARLQGLTWPKSTATFMRAPSIAAR